MHLVHVLCQHNDAPDVTEELEVALRSSRLLDNIFWNWLDDMFFEQPNKIGERCSRIHLLTLEQRDAMERFVEKSWESIGIEN